jgi:hypothetical protein
MERRPGSLHWIATLVASAGAGLLVYWWRLGRPLWVDEQMIALNARWRSFGDLSGPLWLDQTAPVGWLALERAALLIFGINERAARAVPILFGIATLAVAVWIGRRWMTPLGAAILAALCSIGPWVVFFTLELKHYSADMCGALLLPALAAWAIEGGSIDRRVRRIAVWWTAAAVAVWISNGAVFVAPACAVLLSARMWQLHGVRHTLRAMAPAVIWFASFGADYLFALRHALDNAYLANYWSFAFPPVSNGAAETLQWLVGWLRSFALKPVGTPRSVMFWSAVTAGFAYAVARFGVVGVVFASVPLSAVVLALMHVVPPFERLALWIVPALYVGIALCADASLWLASQSRRRPSAVRIVCGIAALAAAGVVSFDIIRAGRVELRYKSADNNYGLDDRRAVRRIRTLRKPGDPVLTTHFGLAGVWWYGDVNVSDANAGAYLGDSPLYEITHEPETARCAPHYAAMDAIVRRTGRAIVYLGFRMNVEPEGFDRLVLDELGRRGARVEYRRFADLSHVALFDFTQLPSGEADPLFMQSSRTPAPPLAGCVAIRPARRW